MASVTPDTMARAKTSWSRRVLPWVAPDGVLLLAAALVLQLDALRGGLPAFARFYPYAVFVVGALLARIVTPVMYQLIAPCVAAAAVGA